METNEGLSADAGHYVAYTACMGEWIRRDDAEVRVVEEVEVFAVEPYVLMYQKLA